MPHRHRANSGAGQRGADSAGFDGDLSVRTVGGCGSDVGEQRRHWWNEEKI
jgi:hypothetical protein